MTDILPIAPGFAVAGQLAVEDFARVAAQGYKLVVKNRHEHEETGQPSDGQMQSAAKLAGLEYRNMPFTGAPPPGVVAAMAELLETAPGPVLAYCRTGRRSIMAWAMAQALVGARRPNELIALAAKAGYDLEGARVALETLAPKP
jgi:uncharacterized protein (TIGR01244 family)